MACARAAYGWRDGTTRTTMKGGVAGPATAPELRQCVGTRGAGVLAEMRTCRKQVRGGDARRSAREARAGRA